MGLKRGPSSVSKQPRYKRSGKKGGGGSSRFDRNGFVRAGKPYRSQESRMFENDMARLARTCPVEEGTRICGAPALPNSKTALCAKHASLAAVEQFRLSRAHMAKPAADESGYPEELYDPDST